MIIQALAPSLSLSLSLSLCSKTPIDSGISRLAVNGVSEISGIWILGVKQAVHLREAALQPYIHKTLNNILMGSECRYQICQNAYIKFVLHALKHKASAVNGILVGRLINDSVVEIADAFPLSHSQIPLLPTLEIALLQVEEYFKSEGLSIIGYYHANERYDDSDLGNIARKIGDQIYRYFPQAAVLLLDNKKLEALPKGGDRNLVVQLYTRDASKSWRPAGSDASNHLTLKEPSANVVLLDYISTEKWKEIVDFDDHLDDISKDWLNADLFK